MVTTKSSGKSIKVQFVSVKQDMPYPVHEHYPTTNITVYGLLTHILVFSIDKIPINAIFISLSNIQNRKG